jgi:hypothetical protein
MTESSPDCARSVPPLTGASSIAMPREPSWSASRLATIGSIVLMLITMCPARALLMIPRSPTITASACAVVSTIEIVRSAAAATRSGESATVAPRARRGSVFAGSTS